MAINASRCAVRVKHCNAVCMSERALATTPDVCERIEYCIALVIYGSDLAVVDAVDSYSVSQPQQSLQGSRTRATSDRFIASFLARRL